MDYFLSGVSPYSWPVIIWAVIGIVLIIIDIATTTFILLFFGIGALITAIATWTGITPQLGGQVVVFSITSLITMMLFRKTAQRFFGRSEKELEYTEYIGQKALVTESIPANGEGRIKYRGTEWIAFSDLSDEIPEGSMVKIEAVDGIKLKVRYA